MHPLNVTNLVLGLLCLGVSGIWLADQVGWVSRTSLLFPVLLIVVGLVSLLAFAGRGATGRLRHRRDETDALPITDTTTEDPTGNPTDDQEALR